MYRAGYDPQAFVTFFEKIQNLEKQKPGAVAKVFENHPQTPDRIEHTEEEIAKILPPRTSTWSPRRNSTTSRPAWPASRTSGASSTTRKASRPSVAPARLLTPPIPPTPAISQRCIAATTAAVAAVPVPNNNSSSNQSGLRSKQFPRASSSDEARLHWRH